MAERSEPDAEPEVTRFPNGNVKFRGGHLDGEMHGEWEFFRTDGSRMRSGAFDRGKQIGVWRTYDRAGKVVKETTFDL
jgi:antitoxin component YwqK of YwqJK toxin-antitoxin module